MAYNMSARTLNKASILLAPDGSLNSYAMGLLSAGVTAYVAFKIAMSVASFGVSTIITTVVNFLVSRLLPTYGDCFFMFLVECVECILNAYGKQDGYLVSVLQ